MSIIWTILIGFVIGLVAKMIHPGKENMGFIMTVILGVAGSFAGSVAGQMLGWYQPGQGAGFIVSVICAVVLLLIYGRIKGGASV
jgi:uncharacterized membrane protein YeaQ/YmgE (transglycosylase-associated protein family)